MSKNDIRLRRQKFTARGPDRFRNYGAVLERHDKEMKLRKIVRVFTFLFIIMIMVMLIIIVVRMERRAEKKQSTSVLVIELNQNLLNYRTPETEHKVLPLL